MSQGENSTVLVLDATVLSNFASSASLSWLLSAFSTVETVPAVQQELRRGVENGYQFLEPAVQAIENDQILVFTAAPELVTQTNYSYAYERLDAGEAEAFAVAEQTDETLVTDDLAARRLAEDYGVEKTGSIGLLASGVVRNELSVETADDWIDVWREERDYYSPVESVSQVLPDKSE